MSKLIFASCVLYSDRLCQLLTERGNDWPVRLFARFFTSFFSSTNRSAILSPDCLKMKDQRWPDRSVRPAGPLLILAVLKPKTDTYYEAPLPVFDPQIVPDEHHTYRYVFHSTEIFRLLFCAFVCGWTCFFFFSKSLESVDPTQTQP